MGATLRKIQLWLTSHIFVWQFTVVFAVLSLVLVGLTALGLSFYLTHAIKDNEIDHATEQAEERATAVIMPHLSPGQATIPLTGEQYSEFDSYVQVGLISADTIRVRLWGQDGTLLYSSDSPERIGEDFPVEQHLAAVFGGSTSSQVADNPSALEEPVGTDSRSVLAVYTPLTFEGEPDVAAALEIHQAYAPIASRIDRAQTIIYVAVAAAMAFLYAALLAAAGRSSVFVNKQRSQLMERTRELKRSHDSLLQVLSAALDLRDQANKGHTLRLARLALAVGEELGLSDADLNHLEQVAMLHDMTKLELPKEILQKAGPLTSDEWETVQKHPELGYQIVRNAPFLQEAGEIILCHHERYDGGGYPCGLAGEEIPLASRVFAVADAYNAMTSDRPYRKAVSHSAAIEEIKRGVGTQFDPKVVEAFLGANLKGLIEDKTFQQEKGEQSTVAGVVGQTAFGEEPHD